MAGPGPHVYEFESCRLEVAERRLTCGGEAVLLPPRAFDVLVVLVERAGSLATKEELMRAVWGDTAVEEANVAVAISTLRRALGRDLIQTVPKHGYRLAVSVNANDEVPRQLEYSRRAARSSRPTAVRAAIALGTTAVLALIVGAVFARRRSHPTAIPAAALVTIEQLTSNRAADSQVSSGPDGRLVFTSDRDGNPEIYVSDADGTHVQRLTHHPGRDEFPRWSPDGRLIAFGSDRGGFGLQLYVMAADGSHVRALTHLPLRCSEPSWSPDGSHLAFRRDNPEEDGWGQDIFTIAIDGSDLRRLTRDASNEVSPAWSPDGRTIAFASNRGESRAFRLFAIDSTGGEPRALSTGYDGAPAWSPDGSELAFVSNRTGGPPQLYVMQVTGGGVRRITKEEARYPSWSRDGTSIVYNGGAPGNLELFRAQMDSAAPVADGNAEDSLPAWSPDGRSLVFTSNRDGRRALFRLDASNGLAKLTRSNANSLFPSWAPDGRRVAFETDEGGEGLMNLCILDVGSTATRCITAGAGTNANPAWSPDGTRIAFQSNRGGGPYNFRIYTIGPDGTALRRVTSGPGFDGDPAWSPDGSRMAFTSDRIGKLLTIFVMKSDGTDVKPLVRTMHETTEPAWSPDGRWIAYTDWRPDGNDVFVVPSTGGAPVRLTYRNGSRPRWNPRGDSIIFTSNRRGHLELFQLRVPDDLGQPRQE